jgi:hypothetical protein
VLFATVFGSILKFNPCLVFKGIKSLPRALRSRWCSAPRLARAAIAAAWLVGKPITQTQEIWESEFAKVPQAIAM